METLSGFESRFEWGLRCNCGRLLRRFTGWGRNVEWGDPRWLIGAILDRSTVSHWVSFWCTQFLSAPLGGGFEQTKLRDCELNSSLAEGREYRAGQCPENRQRSQDFDLILGPIPSVCTWKPV